MTYTRFMELFPSHDACLDYLKERFHPDGSDCPKCGKKTKFHRIKSRAAYGCQYCGHQVYPTAGTVFHKSTTNLQMWFWAIFLMSSTRCGISAKQLEREIGVSYPTAHRMFKQIRTLLSQKDDPILEGEVEVDESLGGGKLRAGDARRGLRYVQKSHRPIIWAAVERGGRVRSKVVKSRALEDVEPPIYEHVLPASMIFTDEWTGYNADRIGARYRGHRRIRHEDKIYVEGNVHTQTVEGFFGLLKNGIRGVYHAVSRKYLQSYLDEYSFRYNARDEARPMFWLILDRVRKADLAAS
jgi:transposase-like protein